MENNPLRHNDSSDPFQQTADALTRANQTSQNDRLEPGVKQHQRQDLYTLASSMSSSPSPMATPTSATNRPPSRPWWSYAPMKLAAVVTVVALLLNLSLVAAPWFRHGSLQNYLIVPEAQAATAFTVSPLNDEQNHQLIGWEVQSLIPTSADEIKRSLTIEPAVEVKVEQTQTGVFRVMPTTALMPEKIYRVSLAALVKAPNGTETPREFSWATQTQADFQILGITPRHQSTGVPVNTGIELLLSREDALDPTPFFTITPAVAGKFEKHGRSWVFLPTKALERRTIYTVTLKKGFGAKDGSGALTEDKQLQFQTEGDSVPEFLYVPEREESLVGEALLFPVPLSSSIPASSTMQMTAYALSPDEAKALLLAQAKISRWIYDPAAHDAAFRSLNKPVAFQGEIELRRDVNGYQLVVPAQSNPGIFAVKIASSRFSEPSWFVWQVTNLTAETFADQQQILTWVMDGKTKQPIKQAQLQLEGKTEVTNDQGLGHVETPAIFRRETKDVLESPVFSVLTIQAAGQTLLLPLQASVPYDQWGANNQPRDDVWSYLYTDRPVYRETDAMNLFGLALDRSSHQPLNDLSLEVRQGSFFIEYSQDQFEKVFDRLPVTVDEAGRFMVSMSWKNRLPGYYQVRLKQGNRVLLDRGIEVRSIEKPPYTIELSVDQEHVVVGDTVNGTIKGAFYDGAPLIGGKIHLAATQGERSALSQDLTLDAAGTATFHVKALPIVCSNTQEFCDPQAMLAIEARPTSGEQAEIVGGQNIAVLVGDRLPFLTSKLNKTTQQADVQLEVHAINWDDAEHRGAIVANQTATIEVTPTAWVQVPDGQYYDEYLNVWQQRFKSERRVGAINTQTVRTDANGMAHFTVPIPKPTDQTQWSYRIVARIKDAHGRDSFATDSVSTYEYQAPGNNNQPMIQLNREPVSTDPVQIGKPVSLHLRLSDQTELNETTLKRGVLYAVLRNGIRKYEILPKNQYSFAFDASSLENVQIMAVAFTDHGFETANLDLFADLQEKGLKIKLEPTAPSVLPGATSTVAVTVRDQADRPVAGASVLINVVDQALEGYIPFLNDAPLSWLYPFALPGLILTEESHQANKEIFAGGGGGAGDEAGNSLLNSPRKIFKDSAAFVLVTTDADGKATVAIPLPENITSWRIEAIALQLKGTQEIKAGEAVVNVATSKPVFVDSILAPRLMTGDTGTVAMRAFGTGLMPNEAVTFLLEAPELGIQRTAVTGTANVVRTIPFTASKAGTYPVRIAVQTAHGSDSIERFVEVNDHQVWFDAWKSTALSTELPGIDVAQPEVTLSFMSGDRASVLPRWQNYAENPSARVELQAAQRKAQQVLRNVYQQKNGSTDSMLSAYQSQTGDSEGRHRYGLSELVYGDPSLSASADVALSAPEFVDRDVLAAYLWQAANDRSLDRTSHLLAIAGLAGLQQPVLDSLQEITAWTDRTPVETAWLIRAWVAVGDSSQVAQLTKEWQGIVRIIDGKAELSLSNILPAQQRFVTTAYALAMEMLRDSSADAFWNSLSQPAAQDLPSVLTEIQYLILRTDRLAIGTSELVVQVPNQPEQRFAFDKQPVQTLRLTQEEARGLRIKQVSPNLVASWSSRVYGLPTKTSTATIQRQYERDGQVTTDWKPGETIQVRLSVQWDVSQIPPLAPNGATVPHCQVVRDFLPGNVQPVTKSVTGRPPFGMNEKDQPQTGFDQPTDIEAGAVSFLICKPGELIYPVRVISSGTYTAEASIVQEADRPSMTAVGHAQVVHVKE